MSNDNKPGGTLTRRDFLLTAGVGTMALGLGAGADAKDAPAGASDAAQAAGSPASGPYNILFILVDQERYFRPGELPKGYGLPAHERLMKRGTTFLTSLYEHRPDAKVN